MAPVTDKIDLSVAVSGVSDSGAYMCAVSVDTSSCTVAGPLTSHVGTRVKGFSHVARSPLVMHGLSQCSV